MNLKDVVDRSRPAVPWHEGENLPWHDPDISVRMLEEHLSQDHDSASRRFEKIDQQVAWIHNDLLRRRSSRILDLACGPGLYTTRLARLGHECVGIDYAPASIAYASSQAKKERLRCLYIHQDVRHAEFSSGYRLIMMIYGEFNVFHPRDAKRLLRKACSVLEQGGILLLEVHKFDAVQTMGMRDRSWYTEKRGVFSSSPHICLRENFWDDKLETSTIRYFVIDPVTGNTRRYAQTIQAYTDQQYTTLLTDCGFGCVRQFPSLLGAEDESQADYCVFSAER
jgi:SAM-dependent methyltransferase